MNYGEIAKDRGKLAQAYCIQDKHRSEVCPTLHVNKRPVFCTSCWFILTRRCSFTIAAFFVDLLLKDCHTTYIAMDQPWYPTVHIEITPIGLLY
jgi:hypothetical protein